MFFLLLFCLEFEQILLSNILVIEIQNISIEKKINKCLKIYLNHITKTNYFYH